MSEKRAKIILIISLIIFGTVGLLRRLIPLNSLEVALYRAIFGVVFMLIIAFITKERISVKRILARLPILIAMGLALALDWILLFESINYTSLATATLTYYMAPIFIILASPFFLGEKLDRGKLIALAVSFFGIFLLSRSQGQGAGSLKGLIMALGAAINYAIVIILNKRVTDLSAFEKTIVQFLILAIVDFIYIMATGGLKGSLTVETVFLLIILGLVHTAIGYAIYFKAMEYLKAQTVSIYSYIDPLVAILVSIIILKEGMTVYSCLGSLCILIGTLLTEFDLKKILNRKISD